MFWYWMGSVLWFFPLQSRAWGWTIETPIFLYFPLTEYIKPVNNYGVQATLSAAVGCCCDPFCMEQRQQTFVCNMFICTIITFSVTFPGFKPWSVFATNDCTRKWVNVIQPIKLHVTHTYDDWIHIIILFLESLHNGDQMVIVTV